MRKPGMRTLTVVVAAVTGVLYLLAATPVPANAKLSKARLGAKALAAACESYYLNTGSGGAYPNALSDLIDPPFKGARLLKNGQQDLIDPWGKPYTYELRTLSDGSQFAFVFTHSPDGVAISQYGVGPQALPPQP